MRRTGARRLRNSVALLIAAACLLGGPPATASADSGYRDFPFTGAVSPTREKPQSKLWFNDGVWWGSLFRPATDSFEIFRFDAGAQAWNPTGTVIDARNTVLIDALWDGDRLYVLSAGTNPTNTGASPRLYRFSYDAAVNRYILDSGFPVTIVSGGMEAAVLAKDTTGRLWMTYTRSNQLYISHTAGGDRTWVTPYVLPVAAGANNLASDDISSVVAYDGKIGVAWSNQADNVLYFAAHDDGAPDDQWTVSHAWEGVELVDDHLNVKALDGDPAGRVFIATKTSLNEPEEPYIMLLVLGADGTWRHHVVGTVADAWTRPQLMIDEENRELYVYAAAGPCCSGGNILYKKTSIDDPAFAPGPGTALIESAADTRINNPTSAKHNVDGATGLLVEASDNTSKYYLHGYLALATSDVTPPDTVIDSGPDGIVVDTAATFAFSSTEAGGSFECELDGGGFQTCASPRLHEALGLATHTFAVRAIDAAGNADPTPAERTWTVSTTRGPVFSDAFESGDFSAWTAVVTGGDGQAVVQSGEVAGGAYAARLSASSTAGSFAYARKALTASETQLTVTGDFNVLAGGTTSGNVPLIRLFDAAGTRLVSVYRQNGTSNRLYVGHSGANHLTAGRLSLHEWARVGVRIVTAGAGSTVDLTVDGVPVYATASASLGSSGVKTLQIGNDTKQQTFSLFADNIVAES